MSSRRPEMTIRAEAPCRVDLAGGTLDLWPLSLLVDGAVTLNAALDVVASCSVTLGGEAWHLCTADGGEEIVLDALPAATSSLPPGLALAAACARAVDLPPARVVTDSQVPRGSGLGGSSALCIALLGAFAAATGRSVSAEDDVRLACNVETTILGLPAGTQDHWAARCGSVSRLDHSVHGTARRELGAAAALLDGALVLADTGVSHHSGMNNWQVFRGFLEGDDAVRSALAEVAAAAVAMGRALERACDDDDAALAAAREALDSEWRARRRLSPAVSCDEVEQIVAAVRSVGGAAKVCGAGGGGMVACLAGAPGDRESLVQAIGEAGFTVLDARIRREGLRVEGDARLEGAGQPRLP